MTTQTNGAPSRRWVALVAAACTLGSLAVAPSAMADETTSAPVAEQTPAATQNTTQQPATDSQSQTGTQNSGSTPVTGAEPEQQQKVVAKIGETTYASFKAAVDAAKANDTVTLVADSDENVTVNKPNITITSSDKANVTYTGTMTIRSYGSGNNADHVTVKGMTFKLETTGDPSHDNTGTSVIVNGATNTVIKDNAFIIEPLKVSDGGYNDPAFTYDRFWSVWLDQGASDTQITGNTFDIGQHTTAAAVHVEQTGTIANTVISDNTATFTSASKLPTGFVRPMSPHLSFIWGQAAPTISGLTVNSNTVVDTTKERTWNYGVYLIGIKGNGEISFSGNKFDAAIGFNFTVNAKANHTVKIDGTNTFGGKYNGSFAVVNADNNQAYKTLAAALEDGAVNLRLLAGTVYSSFAVDAGKQVTLDLNGHTIKNGSDKNVPQTLATINAGGSLTVKDSSLGGTGAVMPDTVGIQAPSVLIDNKGTLKVEGGALSSEGSDKVIVDNQGSLTISGGKFSGTSPLIKTTGENASVMITGGLFTAIKDGGILFEGDKSATTLSGGLYDNVDPATQTTIANGYEAQKLAGTPEGTTGRWQIVPAAVHPGGGTVTVPDQITGIEIAAKPSKTEYRYGEAFDPDGLRVDMVWSSGKRDTLKPAQWEMTGFDSSRPGVQTLSVKLAWDESKVATFQVLVMFKDVDKATPHNGEIRTLLEKDITRGFDDGTFRGMGSLNRQDLAAFLYRMAGQPEYTPAKEDFVFADVTEATPHYREILWAAKHGVVKGYDMADGTRRYEGDSPILRQDLAAMLWRLAGEPDAGDGSFPDVTADTPHREAIEWAKHAGVATGFEDGTFRGGDTIVRQDAAAFLGRVIAKNLVKF